MILVPSYLKALEEVIFVAKLIYCDFEAGNAPAL